MNDAHLFPSDPLIDRAFFSALLNIKTGKNG